MEQLKITGIVTKSINYKETNKLLTIFSLELGVISAVLKGANNAKSKLKFASQPFCFAEFVLAKTGEYLTVTEVNLIESFYGLTENYENYIIASRLLETINAVFKLNEINEIIFLNTIKYLNLLTSGHVNANIIIIKFFLELLEYFGYKLNFNVCGCCNCKIVGSYYINLQLGAIACNNCKGNFYLPLSLNNLSILKIINNCNIKKLNTIKIKNEDLESTLSIIITNIESRFEFKFKKIN